MKCYIDTDSFINIAVAKIPVVIADKFNIVRICTYENYAKKYQ
jgi:hypothetical protein